LEKLNRCGTPPNPEARETLEPGFHHSGRVIWQGDVVAELEKKGNKKEKCQLMMEIKDWKKRVGV
jgi:hypothetical protein